MSTILIADDDPFMEKLLQYTLRKGGYSMVVCKEGYAVMQQILEQRPVLVILDLMIPGRSGLEIVNDIRANSLVGGLPVIFITGQGRESTKEQLLNAGANAVFTKPFSPMALMSTITQLLS